MVYVTLRDLFTLGRGRISITKHLRLFKKIIKKIQSAKMNFISPENVHVSKKGDINIDINFEMSFNYLPLEILLQNERSIFLLVF
jgi:hypothetical protein